MLCRWIHLHSYETLVLRTYLVRSGNCYWKCEKYKSVGSEKILAELIEAGGEALHIDTCKLIFSIWNRGE
jgi:hypothetical protein